MSRLLAIISLFLGLRCFLADCAAITLDEISLKLSSGVSSQAILKELTRLPVYGTFDAEREKEFRPIASPALIDALKSGKYAASAVEELARQKSIEQRAAWQLRLDAAQQAIDEKVQRAAERRAAAHQPPTGPDSQPPSEISVETRVGRQARIAARQKYCQEHPGECETLLALQSASGSLEEARGEAQRTQRDIRSLKTGLWRQGASLDP